METEILGQVMQQEPVKQEMNILCCQCGIPFPPSRTKTNICINCLTQQSDISVGITKEGILIQCRNCRRYQRPPWVYCERESKDLLAICLKRIRGLNKVKIIDAGFIWTESHSRRVKVKLTVQKEVVNNVQIQETFQVEFTEHNQQCEDCKKEYTPHTWGAVVQIRQMVEHKKTFFFLEQLILKHNVHDKCIRVQEERNGLDLFFKHRMDALKVVDFLQLTMPTLLVQSKQLLGTDTQSNKQTYKFTYCIDLPKVCKDDIVILPERLRIQLGATCRLLICIKIGSSIRLLDPVTLNIHELIPERYFQYEYDMTFISFQKHQTEFMVLNCDVDNDRRSVNTSMQTLSHKTVKVQVCRTSDYQPIETRSHLGEVFNTGNIFVGWDLTTLSMLMDFKTDKLPEVILLRKINPNKNERRRIYKLQRMDVVKFDEENFHKRGKKKEKLAEDNEEKQFDEFLDEMEYDPQMRANMNLYRDEKVIKELLKEKSTHKVSKKRERRIVKVRSSRLNESNITSQSVNQSKLTNKQEQADQAEPDWEDIEDDDDQGVKLAELLCDLKLDDKTDKEVQLENDGLVDDFINKLENIKISK